VWRVEVVGAALCSDLLSMNSRFQAMAGVFAIGVMGSLAAAQDVYFDAVQAALPAGYWRLDESSGTLAADVTGTQDGTASGADLAQDGYDGTTGTSAYFDGSDYVEIAHDPAFLIDEGAIVVWFNADQVSSRGELFSKDSNGYDDGGHVTMYVNQGKLNVRFQSDGSSYTLAGGDVQSGVWHHVVLSFGAGGLRMYLDGVLIDSDGYTGGLGPSSGGSGNAEPIAIGANTWNSGNGTIHNLKNYFEGFIDEVALLTTEIDPAGASTLYRQGASRMAVTVPYANDFESAVGEGWSTGDTTDLATFTEFLGPFVQSGGVDTGTSLLVKTTPGETYTLRFDLYVFDNWEGEGTYVDYFTVSADGTELFRETFSEVAGTGGQTYAETPEVNQNLAYGSYLDSIYRDVRITFVATDDTTELLFIAETTATNEFWGIDDLEVLFGEITFTDVSVATGFDIQNDSTVNAASGLLWGDIDRDGDMDVVITGLDARFLRFDPASGAYAAQTLGSSGNVRRQGALLDADRDGDLDFWAANVASYNEERLFASSAGAMSDVGSAGFSGPSNNEGLAAGDVNADGLTDLVMFSENGNWIGINTGEDPIRFEATVDSEDGITGSGLNGNGEFASGADVNNDGYPDFFYHYNGGKLFQSKGNGTYVANNRGISVRTGNSYKSGSAWGDYDNDGDLDLFSPSYASGEAGFLHQNTGLTDVYAPLASEPDPLANFVNVASAAGLDSTALQRSAAWGDFDNDADLDLLITTSSSDSLLLYENQGDGTFELVDKGAAISGELHDAVFVDYDNDGDLDISVTREGDTNVLLENGTDDDRYLKVRAVRPGDGGVEIDVVGARVELWDSSGSSILARRDVGVARGLGGTEPMWAHFGGVDPALTYSVRVVWPGGGEATETVVPGSVSTTFGGVTVDQLLTLTQEIETRARVVRWREVSSVDD